MSGVLNNLSYTSRVLPEGHKSRGTDVKELHRLLLKRCIGRAEAADSNDNAGFVNHTLNILGAVGSWLVPGLPGISGIGIGAGVSGVGALGSGNAAQVVQALIELPSNLLDSNYHKDFTDIVDRTAFNRGGTPYIRPCGWYRFALKVNGKYKDNIWLSGKRARPKENSSADGEWPVSYHGTSLHNGLSIAEEGFKLSKGQRFKFGRGIYSTPDIKVAFLYAETVTLKKKKYKVVMQNRVNPNNLKKISKEETGDGEYWISPSDEDIRPYGFCVQEVKIKK